MVEKIDVGEVKDLMEESEATLVDVLSAEHYEAEHISGAINIPVKEIEEKAETVLPDKKAKIIVYCASKECQASPAAAEKLEELGYSDVYDYENGLAGWKDSGEKLEGEAVESEKSEKEKIRKS